jgi:hypothetical protein
MLSSSSGIFIKTCSAVDNPALLISELSYYFYGNIDKMVGKIL